MMGNQPNQNIFAEQNASNTQNQNVTNSGTGEATKTSTEGDLNAPTATSSSAPQVRTSANEQNRQSTQKAYQQNVGKTQKPAAVQKVQQGLSTAKEGLAQKAQDYAAAQQTKQNYQLDEDTLNNAIEGNSQAASKTSDLLNRSTYNPVDNFDYGDIKVKDANLFDTNAGIKELVSRGQNPRYNQQMAAFDTMLLQMDPNFRQDVQNIKKQANELQTSADETKTAAEKAANEAAKANFTQSQTQARDFLGNRASAIKAENQQEADTYNQMLKNIDLAQIGKDAEAQARAEAQAKLDQVFGVGRATNQLAGVKIDPSQFVTRAADVNADQFWSGDDARRFNQINSLLGNGGQAALQSLALGPTTTTNTNALYNALVNPAVAARQQADVSGANQIQSLLKSMQARADADDARRLGLSNTYQTDLTNMARSLAGGNEFQSYKDLLGNDQILNTVIQNYAANNPAMNTLDLSARDVMSQAEADRLNAIAQDIGSSERYNAGAYQQGGAQSLINTDQFKQGLLSNLAAYRNMMAGQAPIVAPAGTAQVVDNTDYGMVRPKITNDPRGSVIWDAL